MSTSPLVSVYIPTYRRPELLKVALESLRAQTYKKIEVLVCEDPSERDYSAVVDSYRQEFPNFLYLRNDSRSGACYSRNRMIALASGDYVTGLDDDDFFEPDRVRQFVDHPQRDNAAYLCSTDAPIDRASQHEPSGAGRASGWVEFEELKRVNLVGNQIFARRDVFLGAGGFDIAMPAWQDYDLWFRVAKNYGAGFKIANNSYRTNQSLSYERITTSSKARRGFELFVRKHQGDLSATDIAYLQLRDYENRNVKFGLKDVVTYIGGVPRQDKPHVVYEYLKKYVGSRHPNVRKLILSLRPNV